MTDKFTYIDFLMYVIPGSFLSSVLLLSICLLVPETLDFIETDLFSSIIFLLFAFILGNCLQIYSHKGPEERLKKEYWTGLYPSQTMFFSNNTVINEQERSDLLKACQKAGLLTEDDIQLFSFKDSYQREGVNKGQNAFNYMRVYLANRGKGERIRGTEGFFLFYRGIFVASFWAAMAFLFVVASFLLRLKWPIVNDVFGRTPTFLAGFVLPGVGALVCLYFWRVFRYRCRGTAQGFAREVYWAFCADVFIEKEQKERG